MSLEKITVEEFEISSERRAQLVFTSPPFMNFDEFDDYLAWVEIRFRRLALTLVRGGSLVVVLGNEWHPPYQTMRTIETLITIGAATGLELCQMFVVKWPTMLLSPSVAGEMAPLLDGDGDRARDRHAYAWWFGIDPYVAPGSWDSLIRANLSEFDMRFATAVGMHGSVMPHSVMPLSLPDQFIRKLTRPGDLVLDPFAGTNATGAAAELCGRRWLSLEPDDDVYELAELRNA